MSLRSQSHTARQVLSGMSQSSKVSVVNQLPQVTTKLHEQLLLPSRSECQGAVLHGFPALEGERVLWVVMTPVHLLCLPGESTSFSPGSWPLLTWLGTGLSMSAQCPYCQYHIVIFWSSLLMQVRTVTQIYLSIYKTLFPFHLI